MATTVRGVFSFLTLCILSVLATPLVPVLCLLLAPVFCYRWVITCIGPVLCPTLRNLLEPLSAGFASHGVYRNPIQANTVVVACDASLSVEALKTMFQVNILELKDSEGKLVYPELQQKVTSWMGYFFWEQVTDFKLEDYIRNYGKYSKEDLDFGSGAESVQKEREFFDALVKDFVDKRCFREGSSPWEILFLSNDQPASTESYLIFRFHHALSDGLRWGILFKRLWAQHPEKIPPAPKLRQGILGLTFVNYAIKVFILGPTMMTFSAAQSVDHNEWTSTKDWDYSNTTANYFSTRISLRSLKDVKNWHKASLEALLLTCLSGAIRAGMREAGVKLPPKLHCLLPSQMTSKMDSTMRLGNYFTILNMELPIQEIDPLKRLGIVNSRLKSAKRSSVGEIIWLYINLFGKVPSVLLGNQEIHRGPTIIFANANLTTGSEEDVKRLSAWKLRPILVGARVLPGVGAFAMAVGYGDQLRFYVGGNQQVISKDVIKKMEIQFGADLLHLEQFTLT